MAFSSPEWVRLIFLTSQSEPEYLVKGINAGADDYLIKPIAAQVLIAKFQKEEDGQLLPDPDVVHLRDIISG